MASFNITGRKKEIVSHRGRQEHRPKNIEAALRKQPRLISEAVVIGDRRKYLTALVTLGIRGGDQALPRGPRACRGTAAHAGPEVLAEVQGAGQRGQPHAAHVETVKKFHDPRADRSRSTPAS